MRSTSTSLTSLAVIATIALGATPFDCLAQQPCEVAKLLADDGAGGNHLGASVSVFGDTALVGAPLDANAAYVFREVGRVWVQEAKLTASDGADDRFGYSVSLSGDTALVGQEWSNDGSAYVFQRLEGIWTEEAKLTASDAADGDKFGFSVSLSGNTALLGAPYDDDSYHGADSGSAYVFERLDGVWTEVGKLTASDGAEGDGFGSSVSLSSDTALIGAAFDDEDNFWADSGSAYIFEKIDGVWVQEAKLTASDWAPGDLFGGSVSLSANTALIGAALDDDNGHYSGSAYIFQKIGGVWTQVAKLLASDGAELVRFGKCVSLFGDTALVGADGDDVFAGAAYLFRKVNGVWAQEAKLLASDGAAADKFGFSVSLSADTALVGASRDDDNGMDSGSAYVFLVGGPDCNNNDVIDTCDIGNGTSQDCNGNGIPDECDIADGTSDDVNANGVPDECECVGDLTGDGDTDHGDLGMILADWGCSGGNCEGDLNDDGVTDQRDLGILLADWGCSR